MEHQKAPKTPQEEASLDTTSCERLTQLAQQDAKLARIVATNPNTPTETLLELGAEFPEELLNNPVFDLLLLENPNLLAQMPESTLKSLVKLEIMPKSLLNWAVNNASENVLIALLCNPQLCRENLSKLTQHPNSHLAEAAKLHINWDHQIDNPEEFVQKAIAQREHYTMAKTDLILPTEEEEIFLALLYRQMIPAKWISYLVMATKSLIRAKVAKNPNTPVDVLEKLATDSDEEVRAKVAQNLNTPVSVLEILATDSDYRVRCDIAQNPNTPVSVLEKLATDSVDYVRRNLVKNRNTAIPIILTTNSDEDVRRNLAGNPNTPVSLLEKLATDFNNYVRVAVAHNRQTPLNVLEKLATDADENVRRTVANNPNTPVNVLEKLATDPNQQVRLCVACHPNTSVNVLEKLATDADEEIRPYVACHPNTPVSLLERLGTDADEKVRRNVACHANTPISVLIAQFNSLAKSTQPNLGRLAVLFSPYADVAILSKIFASENWLERYAIAQNPHTPDNTLKALVNDSNKLVRQAATVNLQQKQE